MTDWSTVMLATFHHICRHSLCSRKLMLLGGKLSECSQCKNKN